jgi:hypothetical protein
MNAFDQAVAVRREARPDRPPTLAAAGAAGEVEFLGWLDTRTIPLPGEPDRTCDTVAELADRRAPEARWALVLEFQTEPRGDILDRLLEYQARLRRELRHGAPRPRPYALAGAVVHLTGPEQPDALVMDLPGTGVGLALRVGARALREVEAADLLAEIEAGRTARGLLPWVPLMRGAERADIIGRWKDLAGRETDSVRRATAGALALIFAELADRQPPWRAALEGWNMVESTVVAEWIAQGEAKGRAEGEAKAKRADLLRLLQLRFAEPIAAQVAATVEAQADLEILADGSRPPPPPLRGTSSGPPRGSDGVGRSSDRVGRGPRPMAGGCDRDRMSDRMMPPGRERGPNDALDPPPDGLGRRPARPGIAGAELRQRPEPGPGPQQGRRRAAAPGGAGGGRAGRRDQPEGLGARLRQRSAGGLSHRAPTTPTCTWSASAGGGSTWPAAS